MKNISVIGLVIIILIIFSCKRKYNEPITKNWNLELSKTAYSKYGAIDKYGKEIIPPIYDNIIDIYKGYSLVVKSHKLGIIDSTGKIIAPAKYDKVQRFDSRKLGAVCINNLWAFIDKNGKLLSDFKYNDIDYVEEDFYVVELNNKWGIVDSEIKPITPIKYDKYNNYYRNFSEGNLCVYLNEKWGYINSKGKEITKPKYDNADDYKNGRARVVLDFKEGLIDKNGKEIIPLIYDELIRVSNSFSYVGKYDESGDSKKYAIINERNGKVVVSLKYENLYSNFEPFFPFHARLAKVKLKNKVGVVNEKGKVIIPLIYDSIESLGTGYVVFKDGKYGYMDEDFKIIVPIINDYKENEESISNVCGIVQKESSLLLLCQNNKYGFANRKGKIITPIKYDKVESVYMRGAFVSLNGKSGYINEIGKETIPLKIDMSLSAMLFHFNEGILVYRENNKWGAIDSTGVEIVSPKYDTLTDFVWGFSIGSIGSNWYIINKKGKIQKTLKYDKVAKCDADVAFVSKNGRWGLIDKNGNKISPIKYDKIDWFNYNSVAVVKIDFNKYGFPVYDPQKVLGLSNFIEQ